jgi:predicted nucleic acid-binding protein
LQRIEDDAAFWWLAPVSEQVLAKARSLILGPAARTLDAIHVASASLLVGERLSMPFVTADRRQAELAGVAGLEVVEIGG